MLTYNRERENKYDEIDIEVMEGDEKCFFCYSGFIQNATAVHWRGENAMIWLHPGCVLGLTVRLLRDVHACQLEGNTISIDHDGWDLSREDKEDK